MPIGSVTTQEEVAQMVERLMALERRRFDQMQSDKAQMESEKKLWDSFDKQLEALQVALDNLQKESTFLVRSTSTSESSIVTATAADNAATGVYTISGVTLAEAATVMSSGALGLSTGAASTMQSTADMAVSSLDANAAFSGGTAATGLAIDVNAGSFKVNGKNVDVVASDTIYTVLSKINSSGAGVTATISDIAGDERIVLTQNTLGNYHIELTDDSSNFLAAVNLSTASESTGSSNQWESNISEVTALSSGDNAMSDGYFNINGVTFAVDVSNDTLSEVISRINSSAAGVTAFYDEDLDQITIKSNTEGESLIFNNDTSHFLTKVQLMDQAADGDADSGESIYSGSNATVRINGVEVTKEGNSFTVNGTTFTLKSTGTATITVSQNTDSTMGHFRVFVNTFNETMTKLDTELKNTQGSLKSNSVLRSIKRALRDYILAEVNNNGQYSHLYEVGITFDYSGDGAGQLKLDETSMTNALTSDDQSVFKLFANDTDGDNRYDDSGFAPTVDTYLEQYTQRAVGFIDKRKNVIDARILRQDERIDREQNNLNSKQENLFDEFYELFNMSLNLQTQNNQLQQMLKSFESMGSETTF